MGNAGAIYGDIVPTLQSNLVNPQGFSPTDESAMETGAEQSAGGSQAAAVGQGGLQAARTKNAGAASRAISDASRGAGEQLSKNLLGIRTGNADLKERQRQAAQAGLTGVLGLETGAGNEALGQVAPLVNADTNAKTQSWDAFNNITKAITAAGQAAATGAAGGKGCWIAEAIYGVDDDRTHIVRAWLNGPFRETVLGNAVMNVYLAIGRQVAWCVRRSSWMRIALKPLFDKALKAATRGTG